MDQPLLGERRKSHIHPRALTSGQYVRCTNETALTTIYCKCLAPRDLTHVFAETPKLFASQDMVSDSVFFAGQTCFTPS